MESGYRKCSCCKKTFYPAPMHIYRAKNRWQCSYTCYRKEGGDSGKAKKSKE